MAMKFRHDLIRLKRLLDDHDIVGAWDAQPNGVHMMRCPDGANLHWAAGSKTLWCSGAAAARVAMEMRLARILHRCSLTGRAEPS